jgi:hypothetical protein
MGHNNFIVNKYHRWYYRIINRRIGNTPAGYFEKHHILPKSLGGSNDHSNLIALTVREHYICHLLLVKMTSGVSRYKMLRAVDAFKMAKTGTQRNLTARQYQNIRELTATLPNSMSYPEVKAKHLDSIAKKIGYIDHQTYVATVKSSFEQYKTIKSTAKNTGHSQYAIRHLLLNNFGKDWIDLIRHEGLTDAKNRSTNSNRNRPKRISSAEQNYNAHVWEAISPAGEMFLVKGNRIQFCKEHGIGTSLDTKKPHLRGFWEFKKLCKVSDYVK